MSGASAETEGKDPSQAGTLPLSLTNAGPDSHPVNTRSSARQLVLASNNPGKFRELQTLLAEQHIEVCPQSAFDMTEAAETAPTFVENAILKARHASRASGLPAIADDSGIEVDALNGAPGVRSARFAGPKASDRDNIERLLAALEQVETAARTARFRCVLVLLRHPDDPSPLIAEGAWEGSITRSPRGDRGFGYDPVFLPADQPRTAAELEPHQKNRLSHRGKALRLLLEGIRQKL